MATITESEGVMEYRRRASITYGEDERPEVEVYRHGRDRQSVAVEAVTLIFIWNARRDSWSTTIQMSGRYRLKSGKLGELVKVDLWKPWSRHSGEYEPDLSGHELAAKLIAEYRPRTVVVVVERPEEG